MRYKIVFSNHVEEYTDEVEFNCKNPEAAVRAYADAVMKTDGKWRKATVFALPVVVIESPRATLKKGKKVEKSKLFDGYSISKHSTSCGGCSCSHGAVPEKDGFICEQSTWIDSVEWEEGVGMTIHFLSGSNRVFRVTHHVFKTFKDHVAAGGSAGGYYNANFKVLDK
jgi:hypothetical protein